MDCYIGVICVCLYIYRFCEGFSSSHVEHFSSGSYDVSARWVGSTMAAPVLNVGRFPLRHLMAGWCMFAGV